MSSHFFARNFARLVSIALAAFFGLISVAAFASEPPLTLASALQLATGRSRLLTAQDMAVNASREMAVAAGQLPDPVLKFGIDNLPINGTDKFSLGNDFMTMRRVGVMQEITRDDKRQSRAERYLRSAEKSTAEKLVAVAQVQRDTALAWLDRYYAEQVSAVVAEQVAQAGLEIEAADAAYRSGRGSQADVFTARSALAAADDRHSEAKLRVRNTKAMLARWTGGSLDTPLAAMPAMDMTPIRSNPAEFDVQLAHHPQIAVLTKQVEIAQAEAKLTQANKNTDWSVEVAYQQRGAAYANMISIGLSLPLQWDQKNRQDRELSSKLAMVEQAMAERDETLRMHQLETRNLVDEWENNRTRIARFERELIPLSAQRTEATMAAYRGGKTSLSDLLAARRNEIDVRIQALQLQADTARLWAQLNFLIPTDGNDLHLAANGELK